MPSPRSDVRFWSEDHRRMDRARADAVVVKEEEAASGIDHNGDSGEVVDSVVRDPRRRPGLGGASDVCRC